MGTILKQLAKEIAIEKLRTTRDLKAAKLAETYFMYGGKVVIRELERIINAEKDPKVDDTIVRYDRIVSLVEELKKEIV